MLTPVCSLNGIHGVLKTYTSFSKDYSISQISEKDNKIIAKVKPINKNQDFSIDYVIDKTTFLIQECMYYKNKTLLYTVDISYQNIDEFVIPKKITYKSKDNKVDSFIEFNKPVVDK